MAPANVTKLVNDHLRRGQAIAQDLAVHGKSLPARVAQALGQPQFEKPLTVLMELAARTQQQSETTTRNADNAHLHEQTDDAELRAERDQTAAALYASLTRTRGVVDSVVGRDATRKLGFVGDTPADALSLSRLAPVVIARLADLPAPADDRVLIDFAGLSSDLAAALAPLDRVLQATQEDLRENEVTLRARNEALVASTRVQNFALDLLRLCATVVEDADLLHRLRPASPRPAAPATDTPQPAASHA